MIITSKITMDLMTPGVSPIVNVVQNDLYSREIAVTLLSDRQPWKIPEDVSARIWFRRSDGKGGSYDTMPDGSAAWQAEGNVLRFALAPQVLTIPGSVRLTVRLSAEDRELGTFAVLLQISPVAQGVCPVSEEEEEKEQTTSPRKHLWNILPHERLNICCSDIGREKPNTAEHFADAAGNFGYNALSCEVRPTSDGILICYGEPGFTLDADGKITTFDSENFTPISEMTAEDCLALSYADGTHPCSAGAFLEICRNKGKIAFLTIFSESADAVIPGLLSGLKTHNMTHSAIVNSEDYGCLAHWRELDREVMLNYTLPAGTPIGSGQIEKAAVLGYCSLCGSALNASGVGTAADCDFGYAAEKGIRLLQAVARHEDTPEECYGLGYDGCLIGIPWKPLAVGEPEMPEEPEEPAQPEEPEVTAAPVKTDVSTYGVYPGEDCSAALQEAIRQCRWLYFPAGTYHFTGVTITEDTVFVLDPGAHFHTDDPDFMIRASGCSFCIHGGRISSGTNHLSRPDTPYNDASRTKIGTQQGGIIALYGCHDCVFEGITVPYSSHCSVFTVYGDSTGKDGANRPVTINGVSFVPGRGRDIRFLNCSFNNFLLSAIHMLYGNDQILVDGCSFTNALRAKGVDYAYTVYTGVADVTQDKLLYYTPGDGYVIRNCCIENCEGTGIDTHAARNVIYEGNRLTDCDSFLTAYWDHRRVRTAEGWAMENIIIRNNICRTTKAFDYAQNAYPHSPFMIYNRGKLGAMRNLVIENNTIDTNWCYYDSFADEYCADMVCLSFVDNIILRNNVFKSASDTIRVSALNYCRNVEIDNTTLIGPFKDAFRFKSAVCRLGKFDCTKATFADAMFTAVTGFFSVVDTDSLLVLPDVSNLLSGWKNVMNRYAHPLQEAESLLPLDSTCSTYKGFVGKNFLEGPAISSCSGNVITAASCRFVPGTRVYIGSKIFYIMNIESNDAQSEFYFTLDSAPSEETLSSSRYMLLHLPYKEKYTASAAAE